MTEPYNQALADRYQTPHNHEVYDTNTITRSPSLFPTPRVPALE